MDGDTIFIPIKSLDALALPDLRDFLRCLKYMGVDEITIKKLSDRHLEKIKRATNQL